MCRVDTHGIQRYDQGWVSLTISTTRFTIQGLKSKQRAEERCQQLTRKSFRCVPLSNVWRRLRCGRRLGLETLLPNSLANFKYIRSCSRNRLAETFDLWAVCYFVCEINRWWERQTVSSNSLKNKKGIVYWKVAAVSRWCPCYVDKWPKEAVGSRCLECVSDVFSTSWNFQRRFTI